MYWYFCILTDFLNACGNTSNPWVNFWNLITNVSLYCQKAFVQAAILVLMFLSWQQMESNNSREATQQSQTEDCIFSECSCNYFSYTIHHLISLLMCMSFKYQTVTTFHSSFLPGFLSDVYHGLHIYISTSISLAIPISIYLHLYILLYPHLYLKRYSL